LAIVECVPNFSEGRDGRVIAEIAQAVASTRGAHLLDTTSDADHNRSVLTFAGEPDAVCAAAVAAVKAAARTIDLTRHAGVHPRLGAADVVPFVPVAGLALEDCAKLAHRAGDRIWSELKIPVYFYEAAALRDECRRLENVRRLVLNKLAPTGLAPDLGGAPHPTAGVCVVGARKFLVAWNINLLSSDLEFAQIVARAIRESSGGLKAVKAIGLPLASRDQVQVSINLTDFEVTPLHAVFDRVEELCAARGVEIAGSELIGMIPEAALAASRGHDLHWENLRPELVLENRLKLLG
jgi:glutamate formiminotransferase/glutamate formiminotransferase/formiminotetrahydrofolate cyclodeaminase